MPSCYIFLCHFTNAMPDEFLLAKPWNVVTMKMCKQVIIFPTNQMNLTARSRQRGVTIVEYAVGAAMVAGAVLVAFGALGIQISNVLNTNVVGIG